VRFNRPLAVVEISEQYVSNVSAEQTEVRTLADSDVVTWNVTCWLQFCAPVGCKLGAVFTDCL
jgi:hypothetical protein